MAHTCKDATSSQIMLIKRQRRTWRRRLREDMTKVRLLKNSVEQPNHAAGSSSYGEEPANPDDCPRDTIITDPANLISSIASAEGSAPNATLPPPQETPSLASTITSAKSVLPISVDDLSIGDFLTQAPIYSLNPFAQVEPDQAAESRPNNAPIYAEGSFAANWEGQARLGFTGQIDAPIYSLASFAHSPSMHAEEPGSQVLWDAMQPGPI